MNVGDHITVNPYVSGWLISITVTATHQILAVEPDGMPGYARYLNLPIAYPVTVTTGPSIQDLVDLQALTDGDAWNQAIGATP